MSKAVIIIDDDIDDIQLLTEAITSVNQEFSVHSYTKPELALKSLPAEFIFIPDYIFIDYNMPGVTGDRCLKELRRNPTFRSATIIMLSTTMPDATAEHLKSSGADFTFKKPVEFNGYYVLLEKIFSNTQQRK